MLLQLVDSLLVLLPACYGRVAHTEAGGVDLEYLGSVNLIDTNESGDHTHRSVSNVLSHLLTPLTQLLGQYLYWNVVALLELEFGRVVPKSGDD